MDPYVRQPFSGSHEQQGVAPYVRQPFSGSHEQQGVANRGASVRVGRDIEKAGKGYFEDRSPASLTWIHMWLLP
ncbi:hypothetical protein CR513_18501, partial [Mucuna pruriens]